MALNISNRTKSPSKSSNRTVQPNLEIGAHAARVVQIIDLGLQPQRAYKGTEKPPVDMLYLTYELSHDFMVDDKGEANEELPRWISEDFPIYGLEAEKAKSTQRYNVLDPTGQHKGDFAKLLGAACSVVVVHNVGSGNNAGKIFDNIGTVTAPPKIPGYKQPDLVNNPVIFDLSNPDLAVFSKLPQFLQDRIKGNLQFNGSKLQSLLGGQPAEQGTPPEEPTDDENPY